MIHVSLDVKITNFCNFECPFCYQGSNLKGKHANFEFLKSSLDFFVDEVEVFEVIIGGGEPTTYPKLTHIVSHLLSKGVSVAITSRNYKKALKIFSMFYENSKDYPENLPIRRGKGRRSKETIYSPSSLFLGLSYDKDLEKDLIEWLSKNPERVSLLQNMKIHLIEGIDFTEFEELERLAKKLKGLIKEVIEPKTQKKRKDFSYILEKMWIDSYISNPKENLFSFLILGRKFPRNEKDFKIKDVDYKNLAEKLEEKEFILEKNIPVNIDVPLYLNLKPHLKNEYNESAIEKEGTYTFYFDAVNKIISESSYSFRFAVKVEDNIRDSYKEFVSKIENNN